MNALRDLCADEKTVWNDDQNACLLSGGDDCDHVVLTWYKRRGKTECAWMLFHDKPPKPLTLAVAGRIIKANNRSSYPPPATGGGKLPPMVGTLNRETSKDWKEKT